MAFPAGDGFVMALTYGPGVDWTSYSIPLRESDAWKCTPEGDVARSATQADFVAVLSNLEKLQIGGVSVWAERKAVDLDNVALHLALAGE